MTARFLEFPSEIAQVEIHIREAVLPSSGLLREVADHIHLGLGKKLRPRLLILASRATSPQSPGLGPEESIVGGASAAVLRAAAAIELVHVASLIHDDVIDKAKTRRGRPSVNAAFGDDVAILMADLLYSHAFDLALSAVDPEVARLLSRTTRQMCESEIFQIQKREAVLTREDYYYIIGSKTAALFSASAELGGVLSGVAGQPREALSRFGRLLGMAYQVTDDVLDYVATDEAWGKPRGNDLAQGKQTLPLVYTCEKATPSEREFLFTELHNGHRLNVVLPLIEKYGGLDYSCTKARDLAHEAQALIPDFETNSAADSFRELCDFVVQRAF